MCVWGGGGGGVRTSSNAGIIFPTVLLTDILSLSITRTAFPMVYHHTSAIYYKLKISCRSLVLQYLIFSKLARTSTVLPRILCSCAHFQCRFFPPSRGFPIQRKVPPVVRKKNLHTLRKHGEMAGTAALFCDWWTSSRLRCVPWHHAPQATYGVNISKYIIPSTLIYIH